MWPGATESEAPSNARTSPYRFDKFFSSNTLDKPPYPSEAN